MARNRSTLARAAGCARRVLLMFSRGCSDELRSDRQAGWKCGAFDQ